MRRLSALLLAVAMVAVPAPAAAAAPTGVTVSNPTNTAGEALVRWNAVSGAGGYRVSVSSDLGESVTAIGAGSTELTLASLVVGKTYTIKVGVLEGSPRTWSAYSDAVTFTGEGVPAAASTGSATAGVGKVELAWTAGTSTPALSGYYLTNADDLETVTLSAALTSYSVTGLGAGTTHTYKLRAYNRIGSSVALTFPSATTPSAPSVPDTPTVSVTGQTVSVTWTEPASGGNAITGYSVYLIPTSGTETAKDVSGTSTTFTGVAAGDYTAKVLAKNDVGSSARSAASSRVTIAVAKVAQTLSWVGRPSESATVGTNITLNATASSSLAVTYSVSSADQACTIAGSVVSFVANGTCRVIASQAGDSTYEAATAIYVDVAVGRVAQTMSWTPTLSGNGTVGGSVEVIAVPSSGLAVTYSTSTTNVCSVSVRTVTFNSVGNCIVQADQAGNGTYAAVSLTHTFAVASAGGGFIGGGFFGGGGAAPGVKVDQSLSVVKPDGITYGAVFGVTAKASSGLAPTFVSKTPTVCAVEGKQFKALEVGECILEVTQAGDDKTNEAPKTTITFTIDKAQQVISTAVPASVTLQQGSIPFEFKASSGLATKVVVNGACELAAGGLRLLRVGVCEFQVTQAGDSRFRGAVLEGSLQILDTKATPTAPKPTTAKLIVSSTASKVSVTFKAGVATALTLKALPKSAAATITLLNAKKKATALPKQYVDKNGMLTVKPIALKTKGAYQLLVKVKSGTRLVQRTVVITVK